MSSATGRSSQDLTVRDTERRCIATGQAKATSDMIRFVIGPDGAVVPDLARKLPGRGMWLSASRSAVDTAIAKKRFNYAARRQVRADADLADQLEAMLARRCIDGLGLALSDGQAKFIAGHTATDYAATLLGNLSSAGRT